MLLCCHRSRCYPHDGGDLRDRQAIIRRKVTEKVTGVVTANPEKKAALFPAQPPRGVRAGLLRA